MSKQTNLKIMHDSPSFQAISQEDKGTSVGDLLMMDFALQSQSSAQFLKDLHSQFLYSMPQILIQQQVHLENIPDPLGREIRRKQREFNALRAMKFSKLSNANRFKKECSTSVPKQQPPVNYTQYTTFDQADKQGYQSIDSKNASSSNPISSANSEMRKASFHKKASRTQASDLADVLDQFRPKDHEENEYASDGAPGRKLNKQ